MMLCHCGCCCPALLSLKICCSTSTTSSIVTFSKKPSPFLHGPLSKRSDPPQESESSACTSRMALTTWSHLWLHCVHPLCAPSFPKGWVGHLQRPGAGTLQLVSGSWMSWGLDVKRETNDFFPRVLYTKDCHVMPFATWRQSIKDNKKEKDIFRALRASYVS